MRKHVIFLLLVAQAAVAAQPVRAEERHMDFLRGLRELGYYDYAEFYLDQMQGRSDIPNELRQLIPYEKALLLLESVRDVKSPEAQVEKLNAALAYLKQFLKDSPTHPMAGHANTEQARILLGKARVEIWQSRSPSNEGKQAEFQQRAREYIAQARTTFATAHDQHKVVWDSFPKFIDQEENKELFAKRREAEVNFIRAQLDLALCTYEDAQTYGREAPEYKSTLTKAAKEFEDIHTKYRSQVGGLYARMWQGKCFEEQGGKEDIRTALGVYNELLGHPGGSPTMKNLQDQVRHFRLLCLNHEHRQDFQVAVQEADEWLKREGGRGERSMTGLGIRWELALAQDKLAAQRDMTAAERDRFLRQALENVRFVERFPGQYKDLATFKGRDLLVKLRGAGAAQDPEDFDTAFGIARDMVKSIKDKKDAVAAAEQGGKSRDEIENLKHDEQFHVAETARLLQLALKLVERKTSVHDINHARYLLSYAYYLTRRSYESAILSEYVAQHYHADKESQTLALDSAYLAMAAYVQAYNQSREADKPVDMQAMLKVCKLITDHWPDSDRAHDARMTMGRVHGQMKEPAKAADWYSQVPETAPQYSEAQTAAGQAYWTAFLNAAVLPDSEQPPRDELAKWQAAAEQHLRNGIDKMQKAISTEAKPPDEMIAAKVSLVQIVIGKGDYKEAIQLLTGDPHPVLPAILVEDEAQRPKPPSIKSAAFASLTYQLLLRCYVGTQQLDEARAAMQKVEQIAEVSGGGEAVTAIYVQLGQELEKELKRLKGLDDQKRFAEVRQSFETFLSDMFNRQDQTYGSLIWIAETYYGLAQGSSGDNGQSQTYFDKAAATYQKTIDLSKEKPDVVDPSRLTGVKLRLVNCRRRQGKFEDALNLVAEILAEKPKALDAQIEAAYVFQDWGGSGQADAVSKYQKAIGGSQIGAAKAPAWGWGQIGIKLQRLLAEGKADAQESCAEKYMEARYNAPFCRYQFGLAQSNSQKKREELQKAKFEVQAFASISKDVGQEWWSKFDNLYQSILKDLGEKVVKLERGREVAPTAPEAVAKSEESPEPQKVAVKTKPAAAAPPAESQLGMIVFVVLLIGGGGAVVFFMLKQKKPRRLVSVPALAPVSSSQPVPATAPAAKPLTTRQATVKAAPPKKPAQVQPAAGPQPPKPGVPKRPKPNSESS